MNTKETAVNSNVETLDINLDEIFNGAPSANDVTLPEETKSKTNILSGLNKKADFSFTDPDEDNVDNLTKKETAETAETEVEKTEESEDVTSESSNTLKEENESADDILNTLDDETDEDVEKQEKRGRKSINGISDVFSKLIKDDKIVPFDDGKSLDDYSAKDWEELIEANLEEKANQVRRKEYLGATGYGTSDEIAEEIEIWKDLGKLEKQAAKFKPKLDKMQEKIVVKKLEEQDLKKKQQEQASKQYMSSVYETLKEGNLGDIKVDRKTQAMLYNGLVQPSYPSVSGKNTNLLGHLLEKYQFVEPNYTLISEALWLLQDPDGYKAKIMDKGAQKSVEQTVRKLKTAAASNSSASLGIQEKENNKRKPAGKKLPRTNNIFKRI